MGSSTSEELITVADCQSSHHQLDTEAVVSAAAFTLQTRFLDGWMPKCWVMISVRRRGKKHRLVVEVESLASSWKKLRRIDVKA